MQDLPSSQVKISSQDIAKSQVKTPNNWNFSKFHVNHQNIWNFHNFPRFYFFNLISGCYNWHVECEMAKKALELIDSMFLTSIKLQLDLI